MGMSTQEGKRETSPQKDSVAIVTRSNARELEGNNARRQHECNRCRKVFNYQKTLDKHILACKGPLNIPAPSEAKVAISKDETADQTTASTEVHFPKLDEENIEKFIKCESSTPPIASVDLERFDDDKETIHENRRIYVRPDEGELKLIPCKISKLTPAVKKPLRPPQSEIDKNIHSCDLCDATFDEPSSLEEHHSRHLNIKKQRSTQCYLCFKSYKNRSILQSHLMTHTSRFKCEHCGKSLQSDAHLKLHIRRHLGIKSHQCHECNETFVSVGDLKQHKKHNHSKRYECDICGRSFFKKTSFDDHRNGHLGIKPHKCTFCTEAFSTPWHLSMHTNFTHRSKKQLANPVILAGQATNSIKDTGSNKRHDLEMFDDNLVETVDESTSIPIDASGPPYTCPICNHVYALRQSLVNHLITHTSRYNCEHCHKSLQCASHLEAHIRGHLDIKSHQCPKCKKAFQTAGSLRSHEKNIHSKRLKCDFCDRSFLKKTSLDDHRNGHLGIKPHKCTFCTETFSTTWGLTQHMKRTHHSEYRLSRTVPVAGQTTYPNKDTENNTRN